MVNLIIKFTTGTDYNIPKNYSSEMQCIDIYHKRELNVHYPSHLKANGRTTLPMAWAQ